MGKYYYFAAMSINQDNPLERKIWLSCYHQRISASSHHHIILDKLIKAMAANGKQISRDEITLVHPNDWNCPDLGVMQPHCMDDAIGLDKYQSMMEPGIEEWFLNVEKPNGKPMLICSTGMEILKMYGCLYELLPGKLEFAAKAKPAEKKEKKGLFKW